MRHSPPIEPAEVDDQAARLRAIAASDNPPAHAEGGCAHAQTVRPRAQTTAAPKPSGPPPDPPPAPIIAIASGKGGVGKTTLAIALARHAARLGLRTALLDGDLGLANADVMLGINTRLHLGHALAGEHTLSQIAVETGLGFTLVPGGSGVAALADLSSGERSALRTIVDELARSNDLVFLDCGAGIGRSVRALIDIADECAIVTTPEAPAIADAYALIKCLHHVRRARPPASDRVAPDHAAPGLDASDQRGAEPHNIQHIAPIASLSLVVNQAHNERQACEVHARIDAVCRRFLSGRLDSAGLVRADASRSSTGREVYISAVVRRDVSKVFGVLSGRVGVRVGRFTSRPSPLARFLRYVDADRVT